MEFFDFTGTNDEEKAQVLDIISNQSEEVEFIFKYDHVSGRSINRRNQSSKLAQTNGASNEALHSDAESDVQQSVKEASNFTSSAISGNQANQIYVAASPPAWNTTNQVSNPGILHSHLQVQQNGSASPVVCGPQYIFSHGAPYFAPAGPHNPSLYVQPLPPRAIPAMATHSVNQQAMLKDDVKGLPMPSNNTSIASQKNLSKITTPNVSNCDIRNSYYIPNHYSEAPHIVESSRHPASAITLAEGEAGQVIGESDAAIAATNGSAVGVPPPHPHMSPHHPQHPYGPYPTFAHHPAFLPSPHFSPVYIFPHPHDNSTYLHYAGPHFAPNMALPQVSHPNMITQPNPSIDPAGQSNHHHNSSALITSTPSSVTTTLSNLSSSVSASSTSIAVAYHSSQSSQSGTPTSFELADENHNTSDVNNSDSPMLAYEPSNNASEVTVEDVKETFNMRASKCEKVPLKSTKQPQQTTTYQTTFPSLQSQIPPTEIVHMEGQQVQLPPVERAPDSSNEVNKLLIQMNINVSTNEQNVDKPVDETGDSVNVFDLSRSSNSSLLVPSAQTSEEISAQASELKAQTQDSNTDASTAATVSVSSGTESNKPSGSTWASKLFGSSSGAESNQVKFSAISTGKTNSFNGDIEASNKSDLPNRDFPELSVLKSVNNNNYASNRSHKLRNINSDVEEVGKITVIAMNEDPVALRLAKRLRDSIHLKHSMPTIMPCGLVNRGNWCYVNATLQALLSCPPFYNLMRELGETSGIFRQATSTPIIDNFARYFSRFLPSDYKKQIKTAGSMANSLLEELLNNYPFEPKCVYDTLKHIGMIKNDAQRGHQEDAEEFLSSVLNGLHEEMIKMSKLLSETEIAQKNKASQSNGFNSSFDTRNSDVPVEEDDAEDDNMWHEVGTSKHKALPTRSAKVVSTLITEIFGGSILDVRTVNKDNNSGSRQPFFALQLDIKPVAIKNLEDAIRYQTRREVIQGYTCSKTKQIVDAYSQMFLETVPPILIFHLKLFDYDIETGAGRKVLKRIEFSENFEIPRECFHRNSDNRLCRRYKLLGVVYHSGSEAMKGHYITDVYHLGLNQWLRCDDSAIKVISLSQVLATSDNNSHMVPYLLFYRRSDTLYNSSSSSNYNSNSSASNVAYAHSNNSSTNNGNGVNKFSPDYAAHHQPHYTHHHHSNYSHSSHHPHHHHQQQQQHNEASINTSNKFSSISRHN